MTNSYRTHIINQDSICLIMSDGPISCPTDHPFYAHVKTSLVKRDFKGVEKVAQRMSGVTRHDSGLYYAEDGCVYFGVDKLPKMLSEVVFSLADRNLRFDSIRNFWANLRDNPNENSRNSLFEFLERNKCPITADGKFVAYKKVRSNFYDCHTGTIFNGVGEVVRMPREEVDSDSSRTCSHGLHAAAWDYAKSFSSSDNIVEVLINPRDVCAVPGDYSFQKMRVCEYKVIGEADTESEQFVYGMENDEAPEDLQVTEETKEANTIDFAPPVDELPPEPEPEYYEVEDDDEEDEDCASSMEDFEAFSVKIRTGNRGRINVPKAVSVKLGLSGKAWVNVVAEGSFYVSNKTNQYAKFTKSFAIDKVGRFKISAEVAKQAGLEGIPEFNLVQEGSNEAQVSPA